MATNIREGRGMDRIPIWVMIVGGLSIPVLAYWGWGIAGGERLPGLFGDPYTAEIDNGLCTECGQPGQWRYPSGRWLCDQHLMELDP